MGVRRGANARFHLEIGIENQIFLETPEMGISIPINSVVLNRGYTYHLGVRSTKVFRDTRSGNLNQILLNIHRDSL